MPLDHHDAIVSVAPDVGLNVAEPVLATPAPECATYDVLAPLQVTLVSPAYLSEVLPTRRLDVLTVPLVLDRTRSPSDGLDPSTHIARNGTLGAGLPSVVQRE